MATDNALRVGWIGTGVMGLPMCGHLLAAGFPVKVFSRTKERALPLVEQGAQMVRHHRPRRPRASTSW